MPEAIDEHIKNTLNDRYNYVKETLKQL